MIATTPDATTRGPRKVLLIDDDQDYLTLLRLAIKGVPGLESVAATSAEEGLACLDGDSFDLVLTDLQLPGRSGIDFIGAARQRGFRAPMLVLTAHGSVATTREALKLGAQDYLQKPVEPDRLRAIVEALLQSAPPISKGAGQPAIETQGGFEGILGVSSAMREVFDRIARVAGTDARVLIVGESGTGKELVARAIHRRSRRAAGPFVPVHTGAVPRELIASELFGHEKGSFTGAVAATDGKFDAALRGTLFLDEVGTMELPVQVSLLRVLEEQKFTRVGGRRERDADVRVVAATNRDLLDMVRAGNFREDLFYRLNVFTIALPPLRERHEDVRLIAEHYLREFGTRYRTLARHLSEAAIEQLVAHDWPGNVRELRNMMEQTSLFARGEEVHVDDVQRVSTQLFGPFARRAGSALNQSNSFVDSPPRQPSVVPPAIGPVPPTLRVDQATSPFATLAASARGLLGATAADLPDLSLVLALPLGTTVAATERTLILRTLEAVGGNKQKAARLLAISRRCLYNKLATYGISPEPAPQRSSESTGGAPARRRKRARRPPPDAS